MLAKAPRRHQSISKFPQVRRDLAVVVQHDVSAAALFAIGTQCPPPPPPPVGENLVDVRLFDVYVGEGIDSNEKVSQ